MGQPINILLVEDNEDDALFFRLGARRSEAAVVHVANAEAAIAKLETNPLPDLIVMDLMLPGMTVNKFLDWVRTNPNMQRIPIVIHTGVLSVPEELKSAVRETFFKSGDLVETRLTVLKIINLAEPKTGL